MGVKIITGAKGREIINGFLERRPVFVAQSAKGEGSPVPDIGGRVNLRSVEGVKDPVASSMDGFFDKLKVREGVLGRRESVEDLLDSGGIVRVSRDPLGDARVALRGTLGVDGSRDGDVVRVMLGVKGVVMAKGLDGGVNEEILGVIGGNVVNLREGDSAKTPGAVGECANVKGGEGGEGVMPVVGERGVGVSV